MIRSNIYIGLLVLTIASSALSQAPSPGHPGAPGIPRLPEGPGAMQSQPNGPPRGEWIRPYDKNGNGILERVEFDAAVQGMFSELDKDQNGQVEGEELRHRAPRGGRPEGAGQPPPNPERRPLLPPYFIHGPEAGGTSISKADFTRLAGERFTELDTDSNGMLSADEARNAAPPPPPPPGRPGKPGEMGRPPGPPPPPNAEFIGAEIRFGEKFVAGHPFSANIAIEETRRLFDGSLTTKTNKGAIYRDGTGRVRREQPLEMIGGVSVVGSDNQPQMLVFIIDLANRTQIFLDANNKVARKTRIMGTPPPEPPARPGSVTETLGTKTVEGVTAVGTRDTFEIRLPGGKTATAVSERWFSPDLQTTIMSRHTDPMSGEHVFRLTNIKLGEPRAELFNVPAGFRIEQGQIRSERD